MRSYSVTFLSWIGVLALALVIGRSLVQLLSQPSITFAIWVLLGSIAFGVTIFLAYRRLVWGISGFLLVLPFINNIREWIIGADLFPVLPELLTLLLLWSIALNHQLRWERIKLHSTLLKVAFAFLMMLGFSAVVSKNPEVSIPLFWEALVPPLFFLLILVSLQDIGDCWCLLGTLVASVGFGCLFMSYRLAAKVGLFGLTPDILLAHSLAYSRSFYGHPSYFSSAIVTALPIAGILIHRFGGWMKIGLGFLIALMLFGLILGLERGGWLVGLLVILTFFLRRESWKERMFLLIAVIMVFCLFILRQLLVERIPPFIMFTRDISIQVRFQAWGAALRMMLENPIIGVGLGMFLNTYHQYAGGMALLSEMWHAHNLLLNLGAESGIVAVFLFCILLFIFFRYLTSQWRVLDREKKELRLALLIAMAAFLIHSSATGIVFVDFQYHNLTISTTFWMLLALSAVCGKTET